MNQVRKDCPPGFYRNPVTGDLKRIPPPSPWDIATAVFFEQQKPDKRKN